ncbi:Mannose-specific lectin [Carex littledalei]|uniref:non-specific serine/threonine protein kinase n=1 Tax=Carex littledalei TaxID=544730 RepID=A0A833VTA4_9POAL|nr:Mannose-specific lectin [Carex littledalei]
MSSLTFLLITSLLILPIAPLVSGRDVLLSGDSLQPDEYLENENCIFKMQYDCNLVVYKNGSPIWASQTANHGTNCVLLMQFDGDLVLSDGDGNALWTSKTAKDVWNTFPCVLRSDCSVSVFGQYQWSAITNH